MLYVLSKVETREGHKNKSNHKHKNLNKKIDKLENTDEILMNHIRKLSKRSSIEANSSTKDQAYSNSREAVMNMKKRNLLDIGK